MTFKYAIAKYIRLQLNNSLSKHYTAFLSYNFYILVHYLITLNQVIEYEKTQDPYIAYDYMGRTILDDYYLNYGITEPL